MSLGLSYGIEIGFKYWLLIMGMVHFLFAMGLAFNVTEYFKYKNVYVQKVKFLNDELAEKDEIRSYRLNRSFKPSILFNANPVPMVKSRFLENTDYRIAVEDFKKRRTLYKRINYALVPLAAITLLTAIFSSL